MTKIFENLAVNSMIVMALDIFDRISFRHHGIGVLQGYIRENCDPEVRIHIWSKKLLKPGMDVSGDVHDHRFDMVSHVLYGTILHEELIPLEHPQGDHTMMALTHARAAADTNYHGPTTTLGGRYRVERELHKITAGRSYMFPAQKFHHSPHADDDVAVTVVEKWNQRQEQARLLYPVDQEPVMAFGHTPDPDLIKYVIESAKRRLETLI